MADIVQLFNNNSSTHMTPWDRNFMSINYSCLELYELSDFINKV